MWTEAAGGEEWICKDELRVCLSSVLRIVIYVIFFYPNDIVLVVLKIYLFIF